ncbi:MAG: GGDEF domain-containing protein [Actinomycetota bacterium]
MRALDLTAGNPGTVDRATVELLVEQAREASYIDDHAAFVATLTEALDRCDDPVDRGSLLLALAVTRQGLLDPSIAAHDCDRALDVLRDSNRPGQAAFAAACTAVMRHRAGDVGGAIDVAVEALVLRSSVTDDHDGVRATNALAILFAEFGAFTVAHELSAAALEGPVTESMLDPMAYTASYITVEAVHRGVDLTLDLVHEACAIAMRPTATEASRTALGPAMAYELSLLGGDVSDLPEVQLDLRHAEMLAPRLAAWYRLVLAAQARHEDRHDDALAHLDAALPPLVSSNDFLRAERALAMRRDCRVATGDLAGALDDATELSHHLQRTHVGHVEGLASQVSQRADLELARIALHEKADVLADAVATDALTGVRSRRWLDRMLDDLADGAGSVTVVMLDLDHFKTVNDRFGHIVGDEVLQRVGRILRESSRGDDAIARFGGEEFVAVLPGASRTVAEAFTSRIRQLLRDEDWTELADGLDVRLSAGLATGRVADIRAVMHEADGALYEAKRRGRDRVVAA